MDTPTEHLRRCEAFGYTLRFIAWASVAAIQELSTI